ncbi:vascular endothelial growth factor A-like isoform X2 [Pseudomyrmex gracilis]|nr:vascular endothelial growth factor A-like isoform X2 [Pseudomyrmex gracilis]
MQLLQGVPESETRTSSFLFSSRIGEGQERSNAMTPPQARCMPELQPVSLKVDNDPSVIIFPSCTRVNRCGGCCGSTLLSCQPVATEIRNFQVIVSTIELQFRGKRIIPVEEHTKCTCDCKMKEEHCNEKQHYEPQNCMCICNNVDEEEKCRQSNGTKIWDAGSCVCSCRNIEPCSTGYYFNHNTCRCGPIGLTRPLDRFASTKGTNYDFSNRRPPNVPPVQVFPLDPTDPRRRHKEDPEYK